MPRLKKVSLMGLALTAAIMLALLSVFVEQVGPELVQYGDSDYKPVLKGGFPVPYLYDAPGVSRERQLAFGEDKVRPSALAADIALYFTILLVVWVALRRRSAVGGRAIG